MSEKHLVVVVGAGPAGISVANIMSKAGHEVVILNRDVKFGGLAEYGIFPSKHKLRGALRKGYWEVLGRPNVHYFGNVTVGEGKVSCDSAALDKVSAVPAMTSGPREPERASIRPDSGPTGMMIEQDDPVHWQRRKLVNKGFTPQQVRHAARRVVAANVLQRQILELQDRLDEAEGASFFETKIETVKEGKQYRLQVLMSKFPAEDPKTKTLRQKLVLHTDDPTVKELTITVLAALQ